MNYSSDNSVDWDINGVYNDRLMHVSPEELATDNSLRTAENEAAYRKYRSEYEADLINVDDSVLRQFRDGFVTLHQKRLLKGNSLEN